MEKNASDTDSISKEAKQTRAEYYREWRKKNPGKTKEYAERYWDKKQKKEQQKETDNKKPTYIPNNSVENKIVELIDDYLENGLRINLTCDDINSLSTAIEYVGKNLQKTNDLDWNVEEGLVRDPMREEDGAVAYPHPISAIAEALFEIARKK